MTSPKPAVTPALRVARGVLLAGGVTGPTVTAHGLVSGHAPDGVPTLFLSALVAAGAAALADRWRSPLTVVVTSGVAQVLMHALLSVTAGRHDVVPAAANGVRMVIAHLGAGLLVALLLAKADTCLFALAGALRSILPVLPPRLVAHTAVTLPAWSSDGVVPVGAPWRSPISRRGPPPRGRSARHPVLLTGSPSREEQAPTCPSSTVVCSAGQEPRWRPPVSP